MPDLDYTCGFCSLQSHSISWRTDSFLIVSFFQRAQEDLCGSPCLHFIYTTTSAPTSFIAQWRYMLSNTPPWLKIKISSASVRFCPRERLRGRGGGWVLKTPWTPVPSGARRVTISVTTDSYLRAGDSGRSATNSHSRTGVTNGSSAPQKVHSTSASSKSKKDEKGGLNIRGVHVWQAGPFPPLTVYRRKMPMFDAWLHQGLNSSYMKGWNTSSLYNTSLEFNVLLFQCLASPGQCKSWTAPCSKASAIYLDLILDDHQQSCAFTPLGSDKDGTADHLDYSEN